MAFGDIARNALNFVESIKKFFSGDKEYPTKINGQEIEILNKIKTANWNKTLSYSFNVYNKETGKNDFDFSEYKLQINPQAISQSENFSINITPTQGGVISEHNGIIIRDLIISGTTGIQPRKGMSINGAGDTIGGSLKAKSGYDEFQGLRNYFRAYAEFKKQQLEGSRNALLVFINRKDNEQLIIEPVSFTMERQAARSYLYDYKIVCKIIGNFKENTQGSFLETLDNIDGYINDATNKIAEARAIFSNAEDILKSIEREIVNTILDPLRQVSLLCKTVSGAALTISDMPNSFLNSLSNEQIFNSFIELKKGYPSSIKKPTTYKELQVDLPSKLTEEQERLKSNEISKSESLTLSYIENLSKELIRVRDNAAEKFGAGDTDYDNYIERTQSTIVESTREPSAQETDILYAFSLAQQALNIVIANNREILIGNTEQVMAVPAQQFDNQISTPVPPSIEEVILPQNTSLEDLSFQYLGDPLRWIEIVELNNLISPYIADGSTNPRIKKPGDRILIPGTGTPIDSLSKIVKENKYNTNLTETEKKLGIDIKLNKDFDFIIGNNGDFEVTTGYNNAAQALVIKLNLQKGDLRFHREMGVNLSIGEKMTNVDKLYDEVVNAILLDPRFTDIKNFRLSVDGSTVKMDMDLSIIESATSIPVSIPL